MATVTKPMALDRSINTTEQSPRNVADVLAQELSGIATAISGGSDKVPKTDIATVEPTNVASRAYNVGELVYVNGNLYKVITAISGGATFTVGTNIQSTNVSNRVKEVEDKVDTPKLVATVYGNGVKTFAQLLNELFTAYGSSGLSLKYNSWLSVAGDVYQYSGANYFTHHYVTNATFAAQQITLANPSTAYTWENGTVSDLGAIVPYNGYTVSLYA